MIKSSVFLSQVFDCVEEYAPGFKKSIVGHEVLSPPDLEQIFGLTGGVCNTFLFLVIHRRTNEVWNKFNDNTLTFLILKLTVFLIY